MEALGRDDQYLGHLPFLLLPFFGIGISIADTYLPLHAHLCDHFLHRSSDVFCQCTKGRDPNQPQAIFISGTVVRWVFMDELNDCQGAWKSMYSRTEYIQAIEAIRTLGNARKYNITPIILMQSHNVEDIGLSRKYRNQFAVILACASARDEVQNIWKQNDERWQWVNNNPYPCILVGSIPTQIAQHPTHGHHQQFKKVGNAPSNVSSPICSDIQTIPDFQNIETESSYKTESKPKTQSMKFDLSKPTESNNSKQDSKQDSKDSENKFMQILEFCKGKESVSVRDIQRSSVGSNLSSDAIKYAFEWLENNGHGTVKTEQIGGSIRVSFIPN